MLVVLTGTAVVWLQKGIARERTFFAFGLKIIERSKISIVFRIVQLGHDKAGQGEVIFAKFSVLVFLAGKSIVSKNTPAQIIPASINCILDLIEDGFSIALYNGPVVYMSGGGSGMHKIPVWNGLAGHRAVVMIADRKTACQFTEHGRLVRCVAFHDGPGVGGIIAKL